MAKVQDFISRLAAQKLCTEGWSEDRVKVLAQANMGNFVDVDPDTGATRLKMAKGQGICNGGNEPVFGGKSNGSSLFTFVNVPRDLSGTPGLRKPKSRNAPATQEVEAA